MNKSIETVSQLPLVEQLLARRPDISASIAERAWARPLLNMMAVHHPPTTEHMFRVAAVTNGIAQHSGFSQDRIDLVTTVGLLHDIGKLAIPPELLNKPEKLTDLEYKRIQTHVRIGVEILKAYNFEVGRRVGGTHEFIPGRSYPREVPRVTDDPKVVQDQLCVALADQVVAMKEFRPRPTGEPTLSDDQIMDALANARVPKGLVEYAVRNHDAMIFGLASRPSPQ